MTDDLSPHFLKTTAEAIDCMPASMREILLMNRQDGLSSQEIANELRMPKRVVIKLLGEAITFTMLYNREHAEMKYIVIAWTGDASQRNAEPLKFQYADRDAAAEAVKMIFSALNVSRLEIFTQPGTMEGK